MADYSNHKIRRVEVATGAVTTLAGSGEAATRTAWATRRSSTTQRHRHQPGRQRAVCGGLQQPQDPAGGGGDGRGDHARGQRRGGRRGWRGRRGAVLRPSGIAISPDGSALFVADYGNHKIRRVEVATGAVTTLAGSGDEGDADGVGDAAQFYNPTGVAISPDGSALFVADSATTRSGGWRWRRAR